MIDKQNQNAKDDLFQQMMNNWLKARKRFGSGEWTEKQYEDWLIQYPTVLPHDPVEESNKVDNRDVTRSTKKKHPRKKSKRSLTDQ